MAEKLEPKTEKENIIKTLTVFANKAQLSVGKAYTVKTDEMVMYWASELLKDNPSLTAYQVKEGAKNVLNTLVADLPTLAQFRVLAKIQVAVEVDTRKPMSVGDWEASMFGNV